jgi:hypothetical protein
MKVYIGPYKPWISPWDIANCLKYIGVSSEVRDKLGTYLSRTWIANVCESVYVRRARKIKVNIDKWDTWNLDHTLALIIVPCLRQLKETKHGVPCNLSNDDVPNALKCPEDKMVRYGDYLEISLPYSQIMWEWILDEMIWSFEYIIYDANDAKIWNQEDQNRVDNGLRLFGKYYQNLWD